MADVGLKSMFEGSSHFYYLPSGILGLSTMNVKIWNAKYKPFAPFYHINKSLMCLPKTDYNSAATFTPGNSGRRCEVQFLGVVPSGRQSPQTLSSLQAVCLFVFELMNI